MSRWKADFLKLAEQVDDLLTMHSADSRVMALAHQYGKVFRTLLYAEVNGGLDDCYARFPDAPSLDGCQDDEHCYCDLLHERDSFIVSKGLWMEFVGQLGRQDDEKTEHNTDTQASRSTES